MEALPVAPYMTKLSERFRVERIDSKLAQSVVVQNHYLHRRAPCSEAFGLFEGDKLMGVITYGVSASTTLRKGICGPEEANNVYELTRLWLSDELPPFCESFLIGQTLRQVKKEIVVSYADSSVSHDGKPHTGVVYQATNWIYTGLSSKFKDPKLKSRPNLHHTTWAQKMTNKEINDKWGDDVIWVDRPRKHRYVFFNLAGLKSKKARSLRKQALLGKLKYKILPYPKL